MEKVHVAISDRSYDILIDGSILADAGEHVGRFLQRPFTVIVTDETVAELHLETLNGALQTRGIESHAIILPAGEATKSMEHLTQTVSRLLDLKVERDDVILAFGGVLLAILQGSLLRSCAAE